MRTKTFPVTKGFLIAKRMNSIENRLCINPFMSSKEYSLRFRQNTLKCASKSQIFFQVNDNETDVGMTKSKIRPKKEKRRKEKKKEQFICFYSTIFYIDTNIII